MINVTVVLMEKIVSLNCQNGYHNPEFTSVQSQWLKCENSAKSLEFQTLSLLCYKVGIFCTIFGKCFTYLKFSGCFGTFCQPCQVYSNADILKNNMNLGGGGCQHMGWGLLGSLPSILAPIAIYAATGQPHFPSVTCWLPIFMQRKILRERYNF